MKVNFPGRVTYAGSLLQADLLGIHAGEGPMWPPWQALPFGAKPRWQKGDDQGAEPRTLTVWVTTKESRSGTWQDEPMQSGALKIRYVNHFSMSKNDDACGNFKDRSQLSSVWRGFAPCLVGCCFSPEQTPRVIPLGKAQSITEKLLILLGRPFLDPFTREAGFGLGSLSAPVVVSGPASSAPRLQ